MLPVNMPVKVTSTIVLSLSPAGLGENVPPVGMILPETCVEVVAFATEIDIANKTLAINITNIIDNVFFCFILTFTSLEAHSTFISVGGRLYLGGSWKNTTKWQNGMP